MPRYRHIACAISFGLAAAGAAQAQQFSGVISFGDSLSDAGNVGLAQNPAGGPSQSFTTNPDPVAAELLARYFGFTQTPSLAGGSNFAWGGACAQAPTGPTTPPCVAPNVPRVPVQITQHLTATGGAANPNALYTVWAGANDIFAPLGAGLWTSQPQIQAGVVPIATAVIQQAGRLQAAGARNIVVFNLPDLGRTPQFLGLGPNASGAATFASVTYNGALNQGLAALGEGIIPINAFGLVNEVIANPGLYGFTNVTAVACRTPSALVCTPATLVAPNANNLYLFADGVHPTGAAHALLANVVIATIEAPSLLSMASEAPVQIAYDHSYALEEAFYADTVEGREAGSIRAFGTMRYSDSDYTGDTFSPQTDSDGFTATLGTSYKAGETWTLGAALSLSNHDYEPTGGRIGAKGAMVSAFVAANFGGFYLKGGVSGGSTNLDIQRDIPTGPSVRTESGETDARHVGAEFGLGYVFSGDLIQHGPFARVNWQDITIGDYREDSLFSTAMQFGEISRESLIARVGYQLSANAADGRLRPYARVSYNQQDETDAVQVTAGSTTMNGRFTLPGFTPSEDWIDASFGISYSFGESASWFAAYSARLSDDQQDDNSINGGLRITF